MTQGRGIKGTAPIRFSMFSKVEDLEWILDTKCFDRRRVKEVDQFLEEVVGTNKEYLCMKDCCSDAHTSDIATMSLVEKGSVNLKQMHTWLTSIL